MHCVLVGKPFINSTSNYKDVHNSIMYTTEKSGKHPMFYNGRLGESLVGYDKEEYVLAYS